MRIVRPYGAAGSSPSAAPPHALPRAEHHRPFERLPKLARPAALAPTSPRATEALLARIDGSLQRTAVQLRGLQKSSGAWDTPFIGGSFHLALSWLASAVVDAPLTGADAIIDHFKRAQQPDGGFPVTSGDIPAATATRMVILALRHMAKREPRLAQETDAIIEKARGYLTTVHKHDDTLFCAIVDLLAATLDPDEGVSFPNLGLLKTLMSSYVSGTVSGLAHVYLPAVVLLAANLPSLGVWARLLLGSAGIAKLEDEIQARQDPDGGWGWTDLGSALSMIALHERGHRLPSSRALVEGQGFLAGLRETHPAAWTRGDAWDTGYVSLTLQMIGDDTTAERGVARLLEAQRSDGRWSFSLTGMLGDNDTSSTALRALAARYAKTDKPEERARIEGAMGDAVSGLLAYQQENGGWGAFNKRGLGSGRYPPVDANASAIDDTASPDLTARVVRSLTAVRDSIQMDPERRLELDRALERAREFLADANSRGTWWSRWIAGKTSGFYFVVPALRRLGESASSPLFEGSRELLLAKQNKDGGWGETIDADRGREGRGRSSIVHTASAIIGLIGMMRDSEARDPRLARALERGVSHLLGAEQGGAYSNGQALYTALTGLDYYDADATTTCFAAGALKLYADFVRHGPEKAIAMSLL